MDKSYTVKSHFFSGLYLILNRDFFKYCNNWRITKRIIGQVSLWGISFQNKEPLGFWFETLTLSTHFNTYKWIKVNLHFTTKSWFYWNWLSSQNCCSQIHEYSQNPSRHPLLNVSYLLIDETFEIHVLYDLNHTKYLPIRIFNSKLGVLLIR